MDISTIVSSVVSSTSTKCICHPIDTLRTIGQATDGGYRLPLRRYWAGLAPSVALSVPGFTAYLVAYRQTKASLSETLGPQSLTNYIASGAVAEIASSWIWTPCEIIRGSQQISFKSQSTLSLISRIWREEGLRGFYHGYWMGIAVFLPYSVAWWVVYERVREGMATRKETSVANLSPQYHAMAAAAAAGVAVVSTNFLDIVKTRQQLAHSPEIGALRPDDRKGIFTIAKNLINEQGWRRAIFRGMGMRLLSTTPSTALSMAIMEWLHPDPTIALIQED